MKLQRIVLISIILSGVIVYNQSKAIIFSRKNNKIAHQDNIELSSRPPLHQAWLEGPTTQQDQEKQQRGSTTPRPYTGNKRAFSLHRPKSPITPTLAGLRGGGTDASYNQQSYTSQNLSTGLSPLAGRGVTPGSQASIDLNKAAAQLAEQHAARLQQQTGTKTSGRKTAGG